MVNVGILRLREVDVRAQGFYNLQPLNLLTQMLAGIARVRGASSVDGNIRSPVTLYRNSLENNEILREHGL